MKKNSELTYKEMYRQPASFQAVNDTLEDIFKTLDKVFFSEKKYDELIFTGCGTGIKSPPVGFEVSISQTLFSGHNTSLVVYSPLKSIIINRLSDVVRLPASLIRSKQSV